MELPTTWVTSVQVLFLVLGLNNVNIGVLRTASASLPVPVPQLLEREVSGFNMQVLPPGRRWYRGSLAHDTRPETAALYLPGNIASPCFQAS